MSPELRAEEGKDLLIQPPVTRSSSCADAFEKLLKLEIADAQKLFEECLERSKLALAEDAAQLEKLSIDRRARLLRVALIFTNSRGAIQNNIAATKILLGQSDVAIEWLDKAALVSPNESAIWLNAAMANLDMGKLEVARRNIDSAKTLGDNSALLSAIDAELAVKTLEFMRADEVLSRALQKDPDHPYLLLIKSRIALEQGKARESEKSFSKALIQGRSVAANSLLNPRMQRGYALGAGSRTLHLDLLSQEFNSKSIFTKWELRTDRLDVEGRSDAYQWRDRFEGILASQNTTFFLRYLSSGGGRPGAQEPIAGITSAPDSRFRMSSTNAFLSTQLVKGRNTLLGLAKYRTTNLQTRNASTAWSNQVQDDVINLEARLTSSLVDRTKLAGGVAWTEFRRAATSSRPFDPAEVVMPSGTTRAWLAYATAEKQFSDQLNATVGVVAAKLSNTIVLQPIAEVRLGKVVPIRFSITSKVNDTTSDLLPANLFAQSPLENSIDRHVLQPQDFNTSPVLSGRDSRFLNYELSMPTRESTSVLESFVIFHRRMENTLIQAADSRASTNLILTPISRGEATGIEWHLEHSMGPRTRLRSVVTYQGTSGSPDTPTFSIESFPIQISTRQSSLSNFPRFQANVSLEALMGATSYTLTLAYMGSRPRAVTVTNSSGNLVTYVGDADPALGIHFFVRQKVRPGLNMMFGAFNLARAKFYTGYPASVTGFLGFEYRF